MGLGPLSARPCGCPAGTALGDLRTRYAIPRPGQLSLGHRTPVRPFGPYRPSGSRPIRELAGVGRAVRRPPQRRPDRVPGRRLRPPVARRCSRGTTPCDQRDAHGDTGLRHGVWAAETSRRLRTCMASERTPLGVAEPHAWRWSPMRANTAVGSVLPAALIGALSWQRCYARLKSCQAAGEDMRSLDVLPHDVWVADAVGGAPVRSCAQEQAAPTRTPCGQVARPDRAAREG